MDTFKEDDDEEREFGSIKTYEQQRFTRQLQDIENIFRDILKQMKMKVNNDDFPDLKALNEHKDKVDKKVSQLKHQVSSWQGRNSEIKRLCNRLDQAIELNVSKFMGLYDVISFELEEKNKAVRKNTETETDKEDPDENFEETFKEATKEETENLVINLRFKIQELEEQIRTMYIANKIVGDNLQALTQENVNLKEQNKTIVANNIKSVQEK